MGKRGGRSGLWQAGCIDLCRFGECLRVLLGRLAVDLTGGGALRRHRLNRLLVDNGGATSRRQNQIEDENRFESEVVGEPTWFRRQRPASRSVRVRRSPRHQNATQALQEVESSENHPVGEPLHVTANERVSRLRRRAVAEQRTHRVRASREP